MLIFDSFPTRTAAILFAAAAATEHELDVAVYLSNAAAQAADPFPHELHPPVVHVERDDDHRVELAVEHLVEAFGGVFRGT
jgi:hypothetical protein